MPDHRPIGRSLSAACTECPAHRPPCMSSTARLPRYRSYSGCVTADTLSLSGVQPRPPLDRREQLLMPGRQPGGAVGRRGDCPAIRTRHRNSCPRSPRDVGGCSHSVTTTAVSIRVTCRGRPAGMPTSSDLRGHSRFSARAGMVGCMSVIGSLLGLILLLFLIVLVVRAVLDWTSVLASGGPRGRARPGDLPSRHRTGDRPGPAGTSAGADREHADRSGLHGRPPRAPWCCVRWCPTSDRTGPEQPRGPARWTGVDRGRPRCGRAHRRSLRPAHHPSCSRGHPCASRTSP